MKVLIVAAHPDDEVLGAGGTAVTLAAQGADVHVLILAEGVSLRHEGVNLRQARQRCEQAAAVLGAATVSFGGFAKEGRLLGDIEQRVVVDAIARAVRKVEPELVLAHHPGDIHVDHRIAAQSTAYVTRFMGQGPVRQVLHFEVPSSSDQQSGLVAPFVPNVFYDISTQVDAKCRALAAYPYEVHPAPHPRSEHAVRALAMFRGAQLGIEGAEAFCLGRELRDARKEGAS
ncbi:PIG-L deacetylase family protein [Streptomyces sp. NPDC088726]|uniref:PIG-L deacetylase family protein n=1 Tax=Streptomyces sp. NPDC088726 TaxID=3365874 RepID=UPI00381F5F4E